MRKKKSDRVATITDYCKLPYLSISPILLQKFSDFNATLADINVYFAVQGRCNIYTGETDTIRITDLANNLDYPRQSIHRSLSFLLKKGLIIKSKKNRYLIPDVVTVRSIINELRDDRKIEQAEIQIEKEIEQEIKRKGRQNRGLYDYEIQQVRDAVYKRFGLNKDEPESVPVEDNSDANDPEHIRNVLKQVLGDDDNSDL